MTLCRSPSGLRRSSRQEATKWKDGLEALLVYLNIKSQWALKLNDFRVFTYQCNVGKVQKQTVLNYSRHALQIIGQPARVKYLPKAAVQDVIAFLGNEWLTGRVSSQRDGGTERGDMSGQQCLCKRYDLHRERGLPKHGNLFCRIRDDYYHA